MIKFKVSKTILVKVILLFGFVFSSDVYAILQQDQVPSIQLDKIVPGSGIQAVEDIPKSEKLILLVNDALLKQKMNLPGWNDSTEQIPNEKQLFEAFAVRTTQNPGTVLPENSLFYSGKGVGRSGVWEKSESKDAFAYIDGRPLKGLTIKGYGGNEGRAYQPNGSLDANEAYRDTLLSKILLEKGADTYLGALTVVRPNGNANYIRLSRSSLRMNDLIDRQGAELRATVDHLTDVLQDEVGRKLSPQEFAEWILERSARTLAHKEHARVSASNHNNDNFGIAELVDFGEAKYDPFSYKKDYDIKGSGNNWSRGLRNVPLLAAENLSKEYGFQLDSAAIFDNQFKTRSELLIERDTSRVNLDLAQESELKKIGLSDIATRKILALQSELPFGILTVDEVLRTVSLADSDRQIIRRQTTSLLRLQDGHILPESLMGEIGGARGLREVLKSFFTELPVKDLTQASKVESVLQKKIGEKMTALGTDRYTSSSHYGADVKGIVTKHFSDVMKSSPDTWESHLNLNQLSRAGLKCSTIF